MNAQTWMRKGSFSACLLLTIASAKASAQFANGADVSWLPRSEALGIKYYDANGKAGDCLAILKASGIDAIRLRTWVHPNMNDNFSGHCSTAETIQMAQRCKALGLRVMVDFHYCDSWTSVGSQKMPAAWQGKPYTVVKDSLSNYVTDFCNKMKAAGVTPVWFQNGNEINSGIFHYAGDANTPAYDIGSVSAHPDQMTGLLNAGYDAIKAVFPTTKVLIHTAQPQKTAGDIMLTAYKSHGGKLDAIGYSSYAGSGNVDALAANVKTWHDKYNLETIIVEIGSNEAAAKQEITIQHWNAATNAMNKPCEGGTFYWEPEAYSSPGNWADNNFPGGKPNASYAAYQVPLAVKCSTTELEATAAEKTQKQATLSRTNTGELLIHRSGQFLFSAYDMRGRAIASGSALDVANLGSSMKSGVYAVQVQSSEGTQVLQAVKY